MQANSSDTSDIVELTRGGIESWLSICWSNCLLSSRKIRSGFEWWVV